jgi:16S rRNA G966 N2-methylase RsmD
MTTDGAKMKADSRELTHVANELSRNHISALARAARKEIAETQDIEVLGKIERKLSALQAAVKKFDGNRDNMNDLGDALVRAMRKGGGILIDMLERGERQARGGDRKSNRHDDGLIKPLKLQELGFNDPRSRRWQISKRLPDDQFENLLKAITMLVDEVITAHAVVRAGKLYLGQEQQKAKVVPSDAIIQCASWEKWLPKQEACDVLLTDPPYSTDIEDIAAFAKAWVPIALDKVKPTGRAYICIGAYPKELHAYLSVKIPKHLIMSQVLVWMYRNRVGPSPTHDYKLNWQAVLYYRGVDAPELNCSRAVNDYPNLTEQFSVQDINLPDPRRHESWHAWQKPDELCERMVRHASQPADVILDPFAGTGSFILAAARLGRLGLGCDINKDMVKIAKKRGCHWGNEAPPATEAAE